MKLCTALYFQFFLSCIRLPPALPLALGGALSILSELHPPSSGKVFNVVERFQFFLSCIGDERGRGREDADTHLSILSELHRNPIKPEEEALRVLSFNSF